MPPRWLARLVLACFPRSLRERYESDLRAALTHCWREERARHPRIGGLLALARALDDARRARRELRSASSGSTGITRDLAWAHRTLRRSPVFFGGVALTLALGVGVNGTVFSLIKAVLIQPLPYDHPEQLVMIWRSPLHVTTPFWRRATTPTMLHGWIERAGDLIDIAGIEDARSLEAQFDLVTTDEARRLDGAFVTPNFFDVVGAHPALGRVFTAADVARDGTDVVVLSHDVWKSAFAGDPAIVGRRIDLTSGNRLRESHRFLVLGVLPATFRFIYPDGVDIWAPKSFPAVSNAIGVTGVGRLRRGVTFERAAARMRAIHDLIDPSGGRLPEEFRETTRLEPVSSAVTSEAAPVLELVAAVALLLLLVACATTANALLVRFTERRRELAMRAALGATRSRLVRQLLIEGLLVAVAGTVAGVTMAVLTLPLLRAVVPPTIPRADEVAIDWWTLGFGVAAAALTAMLAVLAPAWRGSALDVVSGLKQGSTAVSADRSTARWRLALVAGQAAVATLLLVGAGLLVTSFWRLTHVPLGFDGQGLFTVELRILDERVRNPDALREFDATLSARLQTLPTLSEAALASSVPFRGVDWVWNVGVPPNPDRTVSANGRQVDPGYFRLMNLPVLRGRLFTTADTVGAPNVAIVSESFARHAFGSADPIGRTIESSVPATIVGVVGDVRYAGFEWQPFPAVYVPLAQQPSALVCVLAQAAPGAGDPAPAIRAAIREVDPTLPVPPVTTVGRIMHASTAGRRFYTAVTTTLAGLALVITAAGLIVIVARAVVERRKEMAIRMALGATSSWLVALVTMQATLPVAAGAAVGLAIAWVTAPSLAGFLYSIDPRTPTVYLPVAALVVVISAIAGFVPARRSGIAAPSAVLRLD